MLKIKNAHTGHFKISPLFEMLKIKIPEVNTDKDLEYLIVPIFYLTALYRIRKTQWYPKE